MLNILYILYILNTQNLYLLHILIKKFNDHLYPIYQT